MAKNENENENKAAEEKAREAKAAEAKAAEEKAAEEKARAAAQTRPPYSIADGKSLVCGRGVLGPGEEIKPSDLAAKEEDGRAQLDELASKGYVVKSG